jgi:2,4-dienoyl-CoA reductase-like NADH-dependent reductase (Old Yellow Enzyme family)/thioredoxin reductase
MEDVMNLIRTLMRRRQFLTAATATSTSALAFTKSATASQTNVAGASGRPTGDSKAYENSGAANAKGAFSNRYSHLLSPIKIGNVVLKSRFFFGHATPHYLQGPENFPAEPMRNFYVNLAKNGASIITCRIMERSIPRSQLRGGDSAHMIIYDLKDFGVQNYLDQMVEAIHVYGTKAMAPLEVDEPGTEPGAPPQTTGSTASKMSVATLQEVITGAAAEAKFFASHGFDGIRMRDLLTPYLRVRADQYGGSIQNRARFIVELCQAIKKACSQDFLIELPIRLVNPSVKADSDYMGFTLAEIVGLAKQWEDSVDILNLSEPSSEASFVSEKNKHVSLDFSQAIKKSGSRINTAVAGGFHNVSMNEEYVASGKVDLICVGRPLLCEPEYGKKIYEGRGEDITPCIQCNKCHGISMSGDWYTVCSVNPKLALEPAVRGIEAPTASRKVAVIGGGPAGMKAAITAAERGHKVTLYEKNNFLGGLLHHSDYSPYKWPLKDFKDFLVSQVNKVGIKVVLGTEATPDMIKANGYEVVLVAAGSEPSIPRIPGADGKNVYNIVNVYGKEKEIGKNVVLIGGGEIGAETGIYLAKYGHNVTAVTSEKELVSRYRVHYPELIISTYQHMDNFKVITGVTVTRISEGKVIYADAQGSEKSIPADSVVIYAGLKPRKDEAMKFSGSANRFLIVGDCSEMGGNVQKSIRSAFFAASQI